MLRDVLVDGDHRVPNADVAWPVPLCARPHVTTPVWLVTTDNQCALAAEQAVLWAKWVLVQVGAGQPRPRGLPCGTTLLVATARARGPTQRHRAPGGISTRGPSAALGAPNGAPVLGEHRHWGGELSPRSTSGPSTRMVGPDCRPAGPRPTRRPVALHRSQSRMAQTHWVLPDPRDLGPHVPRCFGGRALQTRHQPVPRGRPYQHVGSGDPGHFT